MITRESSHRLLVLTLLLSQNISFPLSANAQTSPKNDAPAKVPSNDFALAVMKCNWHDSADLDNDYPLHATISSAGDNQGTLEITRDNKVCFSFRPNLFPAKLFVLQDGNLMTVWSHADGLLEFFVFTAKSGHFRQTLNSTSLLQPEFAYRRKGITPSQTDECPVIQSIIVAYVDWINSDTKHGFQSRTKKPITVDIFTWDELNQKYQVKKKIPWDSRFDHI